MSPAASKAKTYDDGVRDGQLKALETIACEHKDRLDSHSSRIRALERVMWIMAGVLGVLQFMPSVLTVLDRLSAGGN
jgi:hypothetical protein